VGIKEAFSYRNPLRLSHSWSDHRSNERAKLLPSEREVKLGRSPALPYVRLIVFL
jgi:hypothetical protein